MKKQRLRATFAQITPAVSLRAKKIRTVLCRGFNKAFFFPHYSHKEVKKTDKLSSDFAPLFCWEGRVLDARSRLLYSGEKHPLKGLGSGIALPTGVPLVRISGSHHHL